MRWSNEQLEQLRRSIAMLSPGVVVTSIRREALLDLIEELQWARRSPRTVSRRQLSNTRIDREGGTPEP